MYTFQNLNTKLKHDVHVNDKVRTDIDLEWGCMLLTGSYPKVGVGLIWKQYLKQLKNYAHLWKLKYTANPNVADANDWVTT